MKKSRYLRLFFPWFNGFTALNGFSYATKGCILLTERLPELLCIFLGTFKLAFCTLLRGLDKI